MLVVWETVTTVTCCRAALGSGGGKARLSTEPVDKFSRFSGAISQVGNCGCAFFVWVFHQRKKDDGQCDDGCGQRRRFEGAGKNGLSGRL